MKLYTTCRLYPNTFTVQCCTYMSEWVVERASVWELTTPSQSEDTSCPDKGSRRRQWCVRCWHKVTPSSGARLPCGLWHNPVTSGRWKRTRNYLCGGRRGDITFKKVHSCSNIFLSLTYFLSFQEGLSSVWIHKTEHQQWKCSTAACWQDSEPQANYNLLWGHEWNTNKIRTKQKYKCTWNVEAIVNEFRNSLYISYCQN